MTTGALDRLGPMEHALLRAASVPELVTPMLATLTDERFSDEDWIFERKLDGERAIAMRDGHEVRLTSRNRLDLRAAYPEIVDALGRQRPSRFAVDGEIVAFEGRLTSFARLQQRMQITDSHQARRSRVAVFYYLFDLVHLDGYDLTALALRTRKRLLRSALSFAGPLRFTPHRNTEGEKEYRAACSKGWEGLIAKRAASPYQHGRSRDWLKFKCVHEQELVIGGYTAPRGSRTGFGALLVGHYEDHAFVYAGKVGTGFDAAALDRLSSRLESLEIDDSPFDRGSPPARDVHWVRPELVCQVGFTEWTTEGRLRHPRFLGLRRDKRPTEVVRERPVRIP